MTPKYSTGAWALALLACSLQFDMPTVLGRLTVYHNELLLALIVPFAILARDKDELKSWSLAFLPLGIWLGLHAFGPDSIWGGIKAGLRAAQMACGLALPLLLLRNRRDLGLVLGVALAALLFSCFWAFAQSAAGAGNALNAGREIEVIGGFQAAAAGFGHHNQMGAFFAAAFCLSLAAWAAGFGKTWALLGAVASLTGLACSYSRGAWIGAVLASLCFLLLLSPRKRLAAAACGFVALLALYFWPSSVFRFRLGSLILDGNRAEHLREVWKLWEGHSFWGWGSDGLAMQAKVAAASLLDLTDEGRASFAVHMHNTYLQIGLSWGWPALLGWLIFILGPLRRAASAWKHPQARAWALGFCAALLAFAVQAFTDVLILHARGLAVSLCWGLMLAGMKLAALERSDARQR